MTMSGDELVRVQNLRLIFETMYGTVKALNGVDLSIRRREVLGLVGESGCGKTALGLSIIRLLPTPPGKILDGNIYFGGRDLTKLSDREMDRVRGTNITMIFQEPMSALNPVFTVGDQIAESIKVKARRYLEDSRRRKADMLSVRPQSKNSWSKQVVEALNLVRISDPDSVVHRYPHELSGGMRQRVMTAMALAAEPSLMIADEPTTALDVTTQAQVLKLMRQLKEEVDTSILFISHDFGVIAEISDRVAVMYAGNIVEEASVYELFENPLHPYTKGLLSSLPSIGSKNKRLKTIPGEVPSLIAPPNGCVFHPRCEKMGRECSMIAPKLMEVAPNHKVACLAS